MNRKADVHVKLSGVRTPDDARFAVQCGVTHIGCILAPSSPRQASLDEVKAIHDAIGSDARIVLEFKTSNRTQILDAAKKTGCRHVQLAGAAEADVLTLAKDKIHVSRVYELSLTTVMLPTQKPEPSAKTPSLFILGQAGTDLTFPWELLGELAPAYTFIGGGVRPENVLALLTHEPWGLNLCAGVESRPGSFDRARLEMLFECIARRS
jgi:phosphoribosylanthranilate isomerase